MTTGQTIAVGLGGLALAGAGGMAARFLLGRRRVDRALVSARYPKLTDVGTVERLTVLPLIDWYTARDELVGEPGVAYLVRADDTTILFDVGYNMGKEHPSPLLRNMEALGISPEVVDRVVISHLHSDHVGGTDCEHEATFALSGEAVGLQVPAFVPEPMSHLTARVEIVEGPRSIAPGVVSLGPIPRQLFFLGWTPEQSLAINVQGKGLVLIIGCGHSTIQRIVERAEMLFDVPIYGVIGGLHLPVTASREVAFGLPLQRIMGTGRWPWNPLTQEDVHSAIAFLQRRNPQLVALSPHDSCDWTISAFRQAFNAAYRDLLVGQEIVVR